MCSSFVLIGSVPFLGTIAAGWPSPAEEELGDVLSFEEWLVPHKESSFLATVETKQLKGDGILLGDIVVIERGRKPQHGDIVIAKLENTTVIRKCEVSGVNVKLCPEVKDINTELLGVVTAVIRKYR